MMVNDTVIIELKSVRRIIRAHEVQLVNYLVATGKPVGLDSLQWPDFVVERVHL